MMAKERNIAGFNCCVCNQPDLGASDIDRDDYLTLFANLLKEHLDAEGYQLFQKKATEFALSKDDNFRWCAHVSDSRLLIFISFVCSIVHVSVICVI